MIKICFMSLLATNDIINNHLIRRMINDKYYTCKCVTGANAYLKANSSVKLKHSTNIVNGDTFNESNKTCIVKI